MENKKKIRLGWIAFCFVLFHFGAILITVFPVRYTSSKAKEISNYYVNPLFSQNWGMFAPCPTDEHTLKFKLYFDDDTTNIIVPSINNIKIHSILRFTHHGDLVVGEYNLLYWIKSDLDLLNIRPNSKITKSKLYEFKKTRGYFLLKNYLTGYSNNLRGKSPLSVDVYLEYYSLKNKQLSTYSFLDLK